MDQNAEELHRLWEEIRQGSTTSCSSLITEKHSDSHSNLSTPSLISDLDLPSPLSAFSVEIQDILNFDLDDILDSPPTEREEIRSEAAFKPLSLEGSHSDNCELITVEDTTLVTSTQSEAAQKRKEGLDNTPPTGNQIPHNSPPSQEPQLNPGGKTFEDNRKHPLSPSITYHGPKQKNIKIDRPPTPIPRKRETILCRSKRQQVKPPPLLKITMKPTPALAERFTKSEYLPLKERENPRKFR